VIDLLKAFRAGGAPLALLERTLNGMPESSQAPVRELLDVITHARELGPPSPAPWLALVFERAGEAAGLSPELLAAVSWTLARFDARDTGGPRVGMMGLPRGALAEPAELTASWEALQEGNRAALAAVWNNVLAGARVIAAKRKHAEGGMLEALADYASPAAVPSIVGAYVLYLGRNVAPARNGSAPGTEQKPNPQMGSAPGYEQKPHPQLQEVTLGK
jgi:hypothetical protein